MNDENDMMLSAGETIKPFVPKKHLPHLVKTLYGLTVESCKELDSYDDRNYHVIVTDQSENPYISHPAPDGYVLKILNKMQSKNPLLVEAQHSMMTHITKKGVPIPKVVKNLKGETTSLEKIYHSENITDSTPFHFYLVSLLAYIPGETFDKKATQPRSLYNIGKMIGRLHNSLEGFHHGFYDTYKYMWNLTELEHLHEFLGGVQDEKRKSFVVNIIDAFTKEVVPKYDKLTKGMVHGDLNEHNIITHDCPGQDNVPPESRVCDVSALIDFNDVVLSYSVFDVAICIAYMAIKCKEIDQRDVGGHVLAGYLSERNLNSTEREIMQVCVCARIAQSLVMGAYTNYMDPSNTYVLATAARGWPLLHLLWETPKPELDARWNKIIEEYEY